MTKNGTVRIQIEIDKEKYDELQQLLEKTGTRTMKDFFNNAVTLLKWAIRKRSEGATIAAINEAQKTFVELEMPILDVATRQHFSVDTKQE